MNRCTVADGRQKEAEVKRVNRIDLVHTYLSTRDEGARVGGRQARRRGANM